MKRKWLTWVLFAAVLLGAYFTNVAVQTHLGKRAFTQTGMSERDLATALATARSENKLVLASLSAIWCPTCRKLDQTIFADEAVQQRIAQAFVFTRIDYESKEGEAFLKRHDLSGFPYLLVLDGKGDKVRQLPITYESDVFLAELEKF